MAVPYNLNQVALLHEQITEWNAWRAGNAQEVVNLVHAPLAHTRLLHANLHEANLAYADLRHANLMGANLSGAVLYGADLRHADFSCANLSGANLTGAIIHHTNFVEAKLNGANLTGARLGISDQDDPGSPYSVSFEHADLMNATLCATNLPKANLRFANLAGADLTHARLSHSHLTEANLEKADLTNAELIEAILSDAYLNFAHIIETNLEGADLTGCKVYGCSVWDAQLDRAIQSGLILFSMGRPAVTIDNLEVAQFINLLLSNEKIRGVIDTITSKVVLILGRFTPERKFVLDRLKEELGGRDYIPVVFDFEGPESRDVTETITTLHRLSRFTIADLSDPRSVPHELASIVPDVSTPLVPIIQHPQRPYGMFEDFRKYPWVLPVGTYQSDDDLVSRITEVIIDPVEERLRCLRDHKSKE